MQGRHACITITEKHTIKRDTYRCDFLIVSLGEYTRYVAALYQMK